MKAACFVVFLFLLGCAAQDFSISAFPSLSRSSKLGCIPANTTLCNVTAQAPWTDPLKIIALDSNGTMITANFTAGRLSERLDALQFIFNESLTDSGFIITGIEFEIRRKLEFVGLINQSRVFDYSVELIMNDTNLVSSNRCLDSNKTANINGTTANQTEPCQSWLNSTAWQTVSYGGPNDLWGFGSIDQPTIQSAKFGIGIRVRASNTSAIFRNLTIDYIKMTIYYAPPETPAEPENWLKILLISTGSIVGGVGVIVGIIFLIGFIRRKIFLKKMDSPGNISLRKQNSVHSLDATNMTDIYVASSSPSIGRSTSAHSFDRQSSVSSFNSSSGLLHASATPYPQVASYPGNQSFIHASSSPVPFIPGKSSTPDVANYAKWPQKGDSKACFGIPMDHVKKSQGIPIVVEECISYLEQYGLREEGILRLAGSTDEVSSLKQTYNSGTSPDFSKINDPNNVAGILKMFFRDLPNQQKPLLMTTGIRSITNISEEEAIQVMQNEISAIPDLNQKVMKRLFYFLHSVVENVDANRMTPNNIAIVFGPTLAISVPVLEILVTIAPHIF